MTTMRTIGGRTIDLLCPRTEDIDVHDIAWHLAMICRFNGACGRHYSVAEHSVLVADLFERLNPHAGPSARMAALMHDAHEAYTGDVISPTKQILRAIAGNAWDMVEARHDRCVHNHFHIVSAQAAYKAAIKEADHLAYRLERTQLAPDATDADPVTDPELLSIDFAGRVPGNWALVFLDRHEQYAGEIRMAVEALTQPASA